MLVHSPLPLLAVATAAMLFALPLQKDAAQDPVKTQKVSSLVPVPRTDQWAIAREKEVLRRARDTAPVSIVFVGDSITQAWEDAGSEFWKLHFDSIGALNLGNSGDRTEHVLYRLEQAPLTRLAPKHVVLMIGTNNLGHGKSNAEQTLAGVKAVITTLQAQCKEATVHVLEIFPRGDAMNPMRGDIAQINQALRAFVRERNENAKTDQQPLRIHAVGDLFVDANGAISKDVMPDSLHLSKDGYRNWGEALLPLVMQ